MTTSAQIPDIILNSEFIDKQLIVIKSIIKIKDEEGVYTDRPSFGFVNVEFPSDVFKYNNWRLSHLKSPQFDVFPSEDAERNFNTRLWWHVPCPEEFLDSMVSSGLTPNFTNGSNGWMKTNIAISKIQYHRDSHCIEISDVKTGKPSHRINLKVVPCASIDKYSISIKSTEIFQ